MLNNKIFSEHYKGLAMLLHGKIDGIVMEFYYRAVQDLSDDDFIRAVNIAAKKYDFMPTPSQLLKCVHGSEMVRAEKAWEKVMIAVNRFGAYESIHFQDGKINEAIRLIGGWVRICLADYEELKYLKHEFLGLYPGCRGENKALLGIVAKENLKNGYKSPKVIEYGGEDKKPLIGYQPKNKLDVSNPPKGGSGVGEEVRAIDTEEIIEKISNKMEAKGESKREKR